MPQPEVEVRRSPRRRRTVSARREGDRIVVLVPASLSRAEEQLWVGRMVRRVADAERRTRPHDGELLQRASLLSRQYLGGRARPSSVRWVGTMRSRWGSCSTMDGTIRLSDRLQGMPPFVVDYVLLHELAHLLVGEHGPRFWALLEGFPDLDRAKGFLDGVAWAAATSARSRDGDLSAGAEGADGNEHAL